MIFTPRILARALIGAAITLAGFMGWLWLLALIAGALS